MEIFDVPQGGDAWLRLRLGTPTASEFASIMAKGKDGPSLTRSGYMRRLAGEIMTGEPAETYSNHHMVRGQEMEAEARAKYAFMTDTEPQVVGFVRNYGAGASPDSLIGEDGALEIKTKQPDRLIEALLRSDAPPEHKAQCQGVLWIAGRDWIDLAVYWPRMPMVIHRVVRDEAYIRTLAAAVAAFREELDALVERLRQISGAGPSLKEQLQRSVA